MLKLLTAVGLAFLMSVSTYTPPVKAQAGYHEIRDHRGYRRHRGYNRHYRGHRGYRYGHRRHRRDWVGPAILGFGIGIGSAVIINNRRHHQWCSMRYRSYNPATGMFLGFDGYYRYCNSPYR